MLAYIRVPNVGNFLFSFPPSGIAWIDIVETCIVTQIRIRTAGAMFGPHPEVTKSHVLYRFFKVFSNHTVGEIFNRFCTMLVPFLGHFCHPKASQTVFGKQPKTTTPLNRGVVGSPPPFRKPGLDWGDGCRSIAHKGNPSWS